MAKYLKDFRVGDTVSVKIEYPNTTNIAGYKFWLTLKKNINDVVPVVQVSTVAGSNVLDDAAHGVCYLQIPSTTTAAIPVGKYYYDLQRALPGQVVPDIRTLIPPVEEYRDKISVLPQITTEAV